MKFILVKNSKVVNVIEATPEFVAKIVGWDLIIEASSFQGKPFIGKDIVEIPGHGYGHAFPITKPEWNDVGIIARMKMGYLA